jgi:hypothetical protein
VTALQKTFESVVSRWITLVIGKRGLEMLILIVEDEAAIARFLKRGLDAHGHRVVCA